MFSNDDLENLIAPEQTSAPDSGFPHNIREPWRSLLIQPFNEEAAKVRFRSEYGDRDVSVPALDPHNPGPVLLGVHFRLPDRMFHYLVKDDPDDGWNRALRLCWIKEGLLRPDRLYWAPGDNGSVFHYYACDVSDDEEYVIIVEQFGRDFRFVTAIPYGKPRWIKLKSQYRRGKRLPLK